MVAMERSWASVVIVVLLCVLALLCEQCVCDPSAQRVLDLLQLQSIARDRVIDLDESSLRWFVSPDEPRPYSLLIIFDASLLWSKPELQLEQLRKEFGLLASAYANNNEGSDGATKVFFCSLEFERVKSTFLLFGVDSVPNIRLLPAGSSAPNESYVMKRGGDFRSAEAMAAFLESKTKQKVGQIIRPYSILQRKYIFLTIGLLVAVYVIKKLAAQRTLLINPQLWCTGALLVYFFSVSGGMQNVIRGMPFLLARSKRGSFELFLQGLQRQLGAECLIVGLLYAIVGLILAFMSHVLVHLRSKNTQRLIMLLGMAISYYTVRAIIALNNWKTGYRINFYWPKR